MLELIIRKPDAGGESLSKVSAEILHLSQQMLCAAQDKQWDAVVELEGKRVPQLEFFASVMNVAKETPEMADLYRKTIISIIDLDQELKRLLESQKRVVVEEASGLDGSRKAVNAYLENASPANRHGERSEGG